MGLLDKAFGVLGYGSDDAAQIDAGQFRMNPETEKKIKEAIARVEELGSREVTGPRKSFYAAQDFAKDISSQQMDDVASRLSGSTATQMANAEIFGGGGQGMKERLANQAINQTAVDQQGIRRASQQHQQQSLYSDIASQEDQKYNTLMTIPSLYSGLSGQQNEANMNVMRGMAGNAQAKNAMLAGQLSFLGQGAKAVGASY